MRDFLGEATQRRDERIQAAREAVLACLGERPSASLVELANAVLPDPPFSVEHYSRAMMDLLASGEIKLEQHTVSLA